MKKVFFYLLFLLFCNPAFAQLYINEFMASNDQTITDDFGDYEDWIEIYNASTNPINLLGYYLSDDLTDPMQWALPDIFIPAQGFLLI